MDKLIHIELEQSGFNEIVKLLNSSSLDGSLLASLLEQYDMQEAPDQ